MEDGAGLFGGFVHKVDFYVDFEFAPAGFSDLEGGGFDSYGYERSLSALGHNNCRGGSGSILRTGFTYVS